MSFSNDDKKLLYSTLKNSLGGVFLLLGFWFLAFLGVKLYYLMLLLIGFILVYDFVQTIRTKIERDAWRPIKSVATVVIVFHIATLLNVWLGGHGLLGLILIGLLFGVYVLLRNRKRYMSWIYHIEKKLYGAPLGGKENEKRESKK